jgi:FixJ family two-component response regulator
VSRVLLVDDDEDLVATMSELLSGAGANSCVVARSLGEVQRQGSEALACEVAIVDVNLGNGQPSGLDVHRWLREQGFGGRTVFLTGHAQSHPLVVAAARLGGVIVLAKPIRTEELLRITQLGL